MNCWLPDDLGERVRSERPDLNVSGALQDALRQLLDGECSHHHLTCADCRAEVSRGKVAGQAVREYYGEFMHELAPLVDQLGTAEGAARIAKRIAIDFGVPDAGHRPLPRPPRSAREP